MVRHGHLLAWTFAAVGMTAALSLAHGQATPDIAVSHAWARATPGGARTAAVYLTIQNHESAPDRLVGGATPVAGDVQIHQMNVQNGVMSMRRLAQGLVVPAKGSATLKPDSYHLMLIGLKHPLKQGGSFPMTLSFATAGPVSVKVSVQAIGAMSAGNAPAGGMNPGMEMK